MSLTTTKSRSPPYNENARMLAKLYPSPLRQVNVSGTVTRGAVSNPIREFTGQRNNTKIDICRNIDNLFILIIKVEIASNN